MSEPGAVIISSAEIISNADVLRHFFEGKVRDLNTENRQLYQDLLDITDDAQFLRAVKSRWPADNDNAVVGWTVGTHRFNHSSKVSRWTEAEVEVGTVYCKRINDVIAEMLGDVRHNLKALAAKMLPDPVWASSQGFHFDRQPGTDFYMIGVRHGSQEYDGTIELLDGAHRLVVLAAQDKTIVKAYIAELK